MLKKLEGGFRRRLRHLGVLRQKGYDMQKLYVTGLQAYAFYGAEVAGLDARQLKSAQAKYLSLVGSPARSRSASVALPVADDPRWRQGLGPVLTWSSMIWKATTSASFQAFVNLPQLGALAGPIVQSLPRTWGGSGSQDSDARVLIHLLGLVCMILCDCSTTVADTAREKQITIHL